MATGYSSVNPPPPRPRSRARGSQAGQRNWHASNGASCGGPAANSQTGARPRQRQQRRAHGAETAARHHVDLLPSLAGAVRQDRLPVPPVSGRRRRAARNRVQMPRDPRALRIVRVVRGHHVQARRERQHFRMAWPRPRTKNAPLPIREHQIEAAPCARIQSCMARPPSAPCVSQRQQRQLATAALAGGRPQTARPVQHRRDHAAPVDRPSRCRRRTGRARQRCPADPASEPRAGPMHGSAFRRGWRRAAAARRGRGGSAGRQCTSDSRLRTGRTVAKPGGEEGRGGGGGWLRRAPVGARRKFKLRVWWGGPVGFALPLNLSSASDVP